MPSEGDCFLVLQHSFSLPWPAEFCIACHCHCFWNGTEECQLLIPLSLCDNVGVITARQSNHGPFASLRIYAIFEIKFRKRNTVCVCVHHRLAAATQDYWSAFSPLHFRSPLRFCADPLLPLTQARQGGHAIRVTFLFQTRLKHQEWI